MPCDVEHFLIYGTLIVVVSVSNSSSRVYIKCSKQEKNELCSFYLVWYSVSVEYQSFQISVS